jgi:hypothetical protein
MNGERPTGDPIAMGIPSLVQHLRTLIDSPGTDLDIPSVEKVSTEFSFYKPPFSTNERLYTTLLRSLVSSLPVLQSDAEIRAVASLVETVMAQMPISAVGTFASDELLLTALGAPHPSANVLGLEILRRFEGEVSGLVFLAAVRCWLEKPTVEVGSRGQKALVNLLRREMERNGRLGEKIGVDVGEGQRRPSPMTRVPDPEKHRLWGLFLLGECHDMIVQACQTSSDMTYQQTSLAQDRLLGLLPDLARLDFEALFTAVAAGGDRRTKRILWWASTEMVDREDEAMVLATVEFYKAIVRAAFEAEGGPSPWFGVFVEKLKDTGRPEVERAARELANEAGMAVARGDEGAAEFGEWLEDVWN